MYDQEGSDNGPKGTYEIYRAEGDALFKQGNYKKAIESYTAVSIYKPHINNIYGISSWHAEWLFSPLIAKATLLFHCLGYYFKIRKYKAIILSVDGCNPTHALYLALLFFSFVSSLM